MKPFISAGFQILFYRLMADLRPDEEDVRLLLKKNSEQTVFVLIHFFGFPSASISLLEVLSKANVWVVSDCAHSPLSLSDEGINLGELGHAGLYSLNKWIPVCDGAILVSTTPAIDVRLSDAAIPAFSVAAKDAYQRHLQAGRDLFSASTSVAATDALKAMELEYEKYYKVIDADMMLYQQSEESFKIEMRFPFAISAQIRRAHADRLNRELRSSAIKLVHPLRPENTVPWCVPARVRASKRIKIQKFMFDRGVLLSTLTEKWNFIPSGCAKYFSVESDFLKEHILIPISEFISEEDMSQMISELNRIN